MDIRLIFFLLILSVVIALLAATALQHRRQVDPSSLRVCRACQTRHPHFAEFCRRCGQRLT